MKRFIATACSDLHVLTGWTWFWKQAMRLTEPNGTNEVTPKNPFIPLTREQFDAIDDGIKGDDMLCFPPPNKK